MAAGRWWIVFGPADLLVHRCHQEPALLEFADYPVRAEVGDDVGLELVAIPGEVAELPVEQSGYPAIGLLGISAEL